MQILKIRYKKGAGGVRNGIEKSMDVLGHREKKPLWISDSGGILGIVFLMTVLLFIGTFLSISLGLPQQSYSMVLVLWLLHLGL